MKSSHNSWATAGVVDLAALGAIAVSTLFLGAMIDGAWHEPLFLLGQVQAPNVAAKETALISLADLQELLAKHAVRLLDARPASFYDLGHIPGAISAPVDSLKNDPKIQSAVLPASKLDPIIVYCSDVSCPASKSAAHFIESLGYQHVKRFAGGFYSWKKAGLPVEMTKP